MPSRGTAPADSTDQIEAQRRADYALASATPDVQTCIIKIAGEPLSLSIHRTHPLTDSITFGRVIMKSRPDKGKYYTAKFAV